MEQKYETISQQYSSFHLYIILQQQLSRRKVIPIQHFGIHCLIIVSITQLLFTAGYNPLNKFHNKNHLHKYTFKILIPLESLLHKKKLSTSGSLLHADEYCGSV